MNMNPDTAATDAIRAMMRLATAPLSETMKYLLSECYVNYLDLNAEQLAQYNELMKSPECEIIRMQSKTLRQYILDEGREEGVKQGLEQGRDKGRYEATLEIVRQQIEAKFGYLPPEVSLRLGEMTQPELVNVSLKLLSATTIADLPLYPSS
jgi:flagellar biosynthesis/type III secretory pathway protein FliH